MCSRFRLLPYNGAILVFGYASIEARERGKRVRVRARGARGEGGGGGEKKDWVGVTGALHYVVVVFVEFCLLCAERGVRVSLPFLLRTKISVSRDAVKLFRELQS